MPTERGAPLRTGGCNKCRQLLDYLAFREQTRTAANNGVVPLAGLEPARCFHHLILSQARLPIPPQGQVIYSITKLRLGETKIQPLVTKMVTNRSIRNPAGYSRSERYI